MKPLLHAIVSLSLGTILAWSEGKESAEKALIGISLTSFNDIITDPVKITERVAFKGKTANSFDEVQHADLRLSLPSKVFRLWREVLPALLANAPAGFKAPEIFPPNLDELLGDRAEAELSMKNVLEVVRDLRALAEKVAKPDERERPLVKVPTQWVDDFCKERQALAMAAMEASEINGGRVAVQNRGADGVFAEFGGMKFYRRISTGNVPEIGPIYCAPFGKNGTWNLYQVINKPVTWLQARAAEGTPPPLDVGKPGVTGHLVSIHSAEENAFVVQIASEISTFWIGLNDRRLEAGSDPDGPWEWSSGEPVTWRNWAGGEPDSGGVLNPREAFDDRTDEDGVVCVGNLESKQPGKWKDNPSGTFYPKNIRSSYVLEWNINAPEFIVGARRAAEPESK